MIKIKGVKMSNKIRKKPKKVKTPDLVYYDYDSGRGDDMIPLVLVALICLGVIYYLIG